MFDSKIFAERLRTLMLARMMSAAQLVRELDTTKATVSRYLSAARVPTLSMLVRTADLFGVTTDYLLGLEKESSRNAFVKCPPFSERFARLMRMYGITVYRLEKDTHINEDTVYGWQKGKYEPRTETVVKLAGYFRCPVDFVLGRA